MPHIPGKTPPMLPMAQAQTYPELMDALRAQFEDLSYAYASQWKAKDRNRRVVGFLPIYVPREIFHACGVLPVGLFGAGDRIPVVRGDAFFQSYICHLPRTVVELALGGQLDDFDGFVFPAICDVIRNLSGIFRVKFQDRYVRYLDFPQSFDPAVGGVFYRRVLDEMAADLAGLTQREATPESLNRAIRLYNQGRRKLKEIAAFRAQNPHLMSAVDFYLLRRAGNLMEVEEYNGLLDSACEMVRQKQADPEDKIRVVLSGSFCEQPPLALIRTIENAGCYIVEDDLQLGLNWFDGDIPDDTEDPIQALVEAYLRNPNASSAVFECGAGQEPTRGERLGARVRALKADGVIFCAPSFCDPALLDRPLLEKAMGRQGIKFTSFQYHENLGQFHVIKEQAGTFADMIKLWE